MGHLCYHRKPGTGEEVLLSPLGSAGVIVKASIKKNIEVIPIIPDEIEKYPWAGHLGIKLVKEVITVINENTTHSFL
jgi:ATP-dependent Lhr-like helicase